MSDFSKQQKRIIIQRLDSRLNEQVDRLRLGHEAALISIYFEMAEQYPMHEVMILQRIGDWVADNRCAALKVSIDMLYDLRYQSQ
jgi:hypothetical protein